MILKPITIKKKIVQKDTHLQNKNILTFLKMTVL